MSKDPKNNFQDKIVLHDRSFLFFFFLPFDSLIFKEAVMFTNDAFACNLDTHHIVGTLLQFMFWQFKTFLLQFALKTKLSDCGKND